MLILILVIYVLIALLRSAPKIIAKTVDIAPPSTFAGAITWPTYGQAAVGLSGSGVLATNGEQKSAPIASIAKTMLALAVLNQKPLAAGGQGPMITMTQADVDIYSKYLAQNGSVVPVHLNEQLSQYQALQALLLPSGDNIAETLAIWAYGSVDNYLSYANSLALKMGMNQTHFADAGGLSPQTVSSAHDLVILGEAALNNPVISDIVSQKQVNLPIAGLVYNYNSLLGQDNIVGIKTGNTDEAGGCLLFATKNAINGQNTILVGAILGASDRTTVLADTKTFLQNNANILQPITLISAGQIIGSYKIPWQKTVNVKSKNSVSVLAIKGQTISTTISMSKINKQASYGSEAGSVTVNSGANKIKIPIYLDNNISSPSILWRLFHP
jgi:D-alanyl-D-alanine carboxypeptidase (penicillin-binding protein 5/6)